MREKNILHILQNSRHTVVLSGAGLMAESGYPLLRDGAKSYDIEESMDIRLRKSSAAAFTLRGRNCFSAFIKRSF